MKTSVAIIGGGVAGCVLSHALERRRIENRVFERNGSTRFSGGALLLWSNAIKALREVGLETGPERFGQELEHIDFCDIDGRVLWRLRADRLARKNRAPCIVVPRAKFLSFLDETVAGRVERQVYERHEQTESGVTSWFNAGPSAESKVLIGADGLHSLLRSQLEGRKPALRKTGQAIWVGSAPFRHERLKPGTAVASVGRGLRFWAAAFPDDTCYWYAIFPERRTPRNVLELAGIFREFHRPVEDLILETPLSSIAKTLISDRHPARRWGSERVTLLGDAVHPVTPDLGQGACQAIESAITLAEELAERGPEASALRRYEQRRRSRTSRISNMSYFTAVGSMVDGALACRVRDLGIATLLPLIAAPQLGWITEGRTAR